MKEILDNTYGILVYQEQIMQIAQKLGGYSLGEADMMRRAMGKKKRSEMAVHEEKFINGSVAKNIKREKAEEIFKLMAQFADYGFNRSHSVAYAYLAYQTAYLKAHFPSFFYASVLSNESHDTTKIYKYSSELRSAGLKLLPPDINESGAGFTPVGDDVRFGLSAIKGIGSASIQSIIETRKNGWFVSLFDFVSRIDQGSVGRRALESLITAGAFDSLKEETTTVNLLRARLFAGIEGALAHGQKIWNDKIRGQNALFATQQITSTFLSNKLPEVDPWTQVELSRLEKLAVGFYLSTHPLDEYKSILKDLRIINIADYENIKPGDKIKLAGIVSSLQVRHSKKGNRFCIFRLEDQSTGVKCLAWSDIYTKFSDCLKEDEVLIVDAKVESSEGQEITLIVEEAKKIADAIPQRAKQAFIDLPEKDLVNKNYFEDIFNILSKHSGNCEVLLKLNLGNKVALKLHSKPLRIQGSLRLENELRQKGCEVKWIL
jgi:DNA polymerase-3 subunit alpha